jgi:anti-sigma factor RsiW
MECKAIQSKLPQYLLGELQAYDAAAVGEHCASCPACAGEVARLQGAWQALDELPGPQEAPSAYPAVLGRIEALEESPWLRFIEALRRQLAPSFAGATAIVMLLGLIGGGLLSSAFSPDSPRSMADTIYAEALGDTAPESLLESYLQPDDQQGQENTL